MCVFRFSLDILRLRENLSLFILEELVSLSFFSNPLSIVTIYDILVILNHVICIIKLHTGC